MSYNIPITLFRDLPVYSGALPPDGVQLVVVEGNNGLYRAGLSSILEGTATVAEGVPAYPGDTLSGELAWEDGAFYVNTESGWEKMAVYSEHWDDIVPGTRFLRVDAPMSLSASEIGNALISLDITEATPSHLGLVYIAESIDDLNKVATAGLVKSYVATFSDRIEEVYTYVQEAAAEIAGDLAIVDAALEEIRDIGSGVESAKSYVDDVKDDVDLLASSAASSAGRAEMAAERAEQASGALPGFDETPTADSRNVVRSGGIKLWGDTSFVPLSHVEDIGTGYSEPHVSDDDRERWDAAAGGTIPDRYMEVLASLADDGAITGPDIKIGVAEDDTIIWARDIGVDGKTALTLTSDSLSVVAGDGADITGDTHIEGDLDVSGTVTAGGHAVVTVNDAGAFPTGGSLVDGYAGVADAVEYIATVETSIKDYVAANYSRVPVEGGYAERAGDNTMTGSNVFTGEVMFTGPVSVDGHVLSCGGGLSVDGGDIDLGTGWSINAPDANISTISADLVDIGTGGSLRVDGDTNVVDIGIGGDARIHGTAVVDGTLTVGGDFSVDGIATFGDIIDSDVIIGHGPIGKVRAQALLEIGDPKSAGTFTYNGYTVNMAAGARTKAHGSLELVDGYETCVVIIGDETRAIGPVPRNAGASASLLSDTSPVSAPNGGEGTCASCLFGPQPATPCGYKASAGSGGSRTKGIIVHWNGAGGPGMMDNAVFFVPDIGTAAPTLLDVQEAIASDPVFSKILEASLVDPSADCSTAVVSLRAKKAGALYNNFGISAYAGSGSSSEARSIPEVALQGGGGLQEATNAIGVLTIVYPDSSTHAGSYFFNELNLIPRESGGLEIKLYKGSSVLASGYVAPPATGADHVAESVVAELGSMLSAAGIPGAISFYRTIFDSTNPYSYGTIKGMVATPGADGNNYRVHMKILPGEYSYDSYTFEIKFFAGADAYDPGTGSETPGPGPTPEYDPVTPQQVATLVSTIPGYTGTVNSTDPYVVDVDAIQEGSAGNKNMEAYGGLLVNTPLGGGSDDRDVSALASVISSTDVFDLQASVHSPSAILLKAKQAGEAPNGMAVTTTGCFGTDGTTMGSRVPGEDGIPGTHYNLMLNGERITPGGGGGGSVEVDDIPEAGGRNPISSGWAYTHSTTPGMHWTEVDRGLVWQHTQCLMHMMSLPAGNSDSYARYFILDSRYAQRGLLKSLTLKCRASGTAQQQPFYIGVFERPEGGGADPSSWNFLGASDEAAQEVIGRSRSWNFNNVEVVGGRQLAFCPMSTPNQGWSTDIVIGLRCRSREAWDSSSIVYGETGGAQALVPQMTMSSMLLVGEHVADSSVHLDALERDLVNNLDAGWLWYPGRTGSVTVAGDTGGNPNGVSIQSTNAYGRIEIQDYGVVITATRNPQWLDASTTSYAFYDILTTKDFNPSSVPALSSRVTAVEGGVAALEANSHSMRTITYADKHGTVQVVAYYGDTASDFLGVCFPNGFTIAGKTWYMMSRNEFDSLAVASGNRRTITSADGDVVFYEPTATGGSAIFRVDSRYNGVQGGVTSSWAASVNYGSITVSQPAAYALPTAQEAARVRMLDVASNAADRRADRLERVVSNLGNGLLTLTEDDMYFASPGTNNNGTYSLSNGTLSMSGGGGYSMVMLHKAARHFEATTTAGQQFAIMVACKPDDSTGGVGVFIAGGNNVFICDKSDHNLAVSGTVPGYTKLSSVPAGKVVVDIIDMSASPQAGTGYTKRVVLSVGGSKVLDTYIDGGLGSKTAYTEPRIGVLGNWSRNGVWTLTDCKVSYSDVFARDIPYNHETVVPSVLQHGHVYDIAVSDGTVDLSGVTVGNGATAELYIDYTAGTLVLPAWWWIDGTSSSEGDHDIPPWGHAMEANRRYVVTVSNDGRKVVAKVQYDYPL